MELENDDEVGIEESIGFDIATTIAIVSQFMQKLGYEH